MYSGLHSARSANCAGSSKEVRSADWLGVAEWSPRTKNALRDAQADPAQFALLALCSPEYLVSA